MGRVDENRAPSEKKPNKNINIRQQHGAGYYAKHTSIFQYMTPNSHAIQPQLKGQQQSPDLWERLWSFSMHTATEGVILTLSISNFTTLDHTTALVGTATVDSLWVASYNRSGNIFKGVVRCKWQLFHQFRNSQATMRVRWEMNDG